MILTGFLLLGAALALVVIIIIIGAAIGERGPATPPEAMRLARRQRQVEAESAKEMRMSVMNASEARPGTASPELTKHDTGKVRLSLMAKESILEGAKAMEFGAKSYGDHNWRRGSDWLRYWDAAQRHLWAWRSGEDYDAESGINHLAHAFCCIMILLSFVLTGKGSDNR